ncbi:MAG: carboxylesterase family protein, partial [Clostridiales bacterium]|nr:carboxylesterase family protein [Clostridiales bacterium]
QGGYIGNAPHKTSASAGTPLKHGFRDYAGNIPLMVGTVFGEFDFLPPLPDKKNMSREYITELIHQKYGDDGDVLIPLFEKAYPDKNLVELLAVDTLFRIPTIELIKARMKNAIAPTYSYQFTYTFPLYDGKIAWHCSEIPFVFHNIDKVPVCNGDKTGEKLQKDVFGAWISFAKTGKPVIDGVDWEACKKDDEAVMILDTTCEIRHNFDHELLSQVKKYLKPEMMDFGEIQH